MRLYELLLISQALPFDFCVSVESIHYETLRFSVPFREFLVRVGSQGPGPARCELLTIFRDIRIFSRGHSVSASGAS